MRRLIVFSLLALGPAWSQTTSLDANSIVVFATTTIVLPPTDVTFIVTANADASTTLAQVLGAVGFNLTPNDVVFVTSAPLSGLPPATGPLPVSRIQYTFRLTVPINAMTETINKLESFRTSNTAIVLSYTTNSFGPNEAAAEQAQQAALPDLMANARKLAESAATAAQLELGRIQAVSPSGFTVPSYASPSSVFTISATVRFAAQ